MDFYVNKLRGYVYPLAMAVLLSTHALALDQPYNEDPSTPEAANPKTTQKQLKQILQKPFDKAAQDSIVSSWLDHRMNHSIKDPLDAYIDEILKQSEFIQQLLPDVKHALQQQTKSTRLQLLASSALATNEQYARVLEIASKVAKEMNFSEEARENMKVFVLESPVLNAFTYSGLPKMFVDVAVFRRMAEELTDDQLAGLFGHELGHIKAEHVLNQYLIVVTFLATGESLIPETSSPYMTRKLRAKFRQPLIEKFQKMLFHDTSPSLGKVAFGVQQSLAKALFEKAELHAKRLRQIAGEKNLHEFTKKLAIPMLHPGKDRNYITNLKAKKTLTMEDVERFVASLERYSRSCETSCDNYGLLVSDLASVQQLDMKLAGGDGTTLAGMDAQAKEFLKLIKEHPELLEDYAETQKTHPASLWRVQRYEAFEKTVAFKVYSDPFLKVLDTYLGVAKFLEEEELNVAYPEHFMEAHETILSSENFDRFVAFEAELLSSLLEVLRVEMESITPSDKLVETFEFIQALGKQKNTLAIQRITQPGGLLFELARFTEAEKSNAIAKEVGGIVDRMIRDLQTRGRAIGMDLQLRIQKLADHNQYNDQQGPSCSDHLKPSKNG